MNILPLILAFACTKAPINVEVKAVPTGVEVSSTSDLQRVEIRSDSDSLVARHSPLDGVLQHWYPVDWNAHDTVTLKSHRNEQEWLSVVHRPKTISTLRISAPLGQPATSPGPEQNIQFPTLSETSTVGVSLSTIKAGPISINLGDESLNLRSAISGQNLFLAAEISEPVTIEISAEGQRTATTLIPIRLDPNEVRQAIQIEQVRYPTDHRGQADLARPKQSITLASSWWTDLIRRAGLSFRPRDRTVPWAHQAVSIRNVSPSDLNLMVRTRVTQNGEPDPVFLPKMRDVDDGTGWVSVLLFVEAGGTAEAVLPIFVDDRLLEEDGRTGPERTHQVEVAALGGQTVLREYSQRLAIQRGSTTALAAMTVGLFASFAGLIMLATRLRKWLSLPTPTLVTIALFGTLSFVVNAAVQLIGMGVASLLGPFAFILTGLLDDTIRAALLIVLLNLRPSPGVCALSVLIGWLLRAVTTGSASPTDFLYLTSHIFFLEASIWLMGMTRGRKLTGFRIASALSLSFSASIATALAFNVVLYRLFYADWYIGLNIGLSGVVYPAIATALAMPVAKSLISVED